MNEHVHASLVVEHVRRVDAEHHDRVQVQAGRDSPQFFLGGSVAHQQKLQAGDSAVTHCACAEQLVHTLVVDELADVTNDEIIPGESTSSAN